MCLWLSSTWRIEPWKKTAKFQCCGRVLSLEFVSAVRTSAKDCFKENSPRFRAAKYWGIYYCWPFELKT